MPINSKSYFIAYCKVQGISIGLASKIIDGRYKPYLSALDDFYYKGTDLWDSKTIALQAVIEKYDVPTVISKLKAVK